MSDIEVRTYLRSSSGEFIDIHSSEAAGGKGPYLEGAVEITAHGRVALGRQLWGEVEFIWWGIADMVAEFLDHGSGRMDLPDLPTSVTLTHRDGSWVRIETVTWQGEVISGSSAQRTELLEALRDAGLSALARMLELKPANLRNHEMAMARLRTIGG